MTASPALQFDFALPPFALGDFSTAFSLKELVLNE